MSAAKRPPAPPPTLAGFTYLDVLGSGGFADVYLYEQHLPRRRVAVKVMLEGRMAGGAAEQFAAEANVMALLSTHPAIVTIYQAGVSDDGRPYLVMEYCPRPNLQVRSRAAAFSVAEALRAGGVPASRLRSWGLGDTDPVAPNDSPRNRSLNRRVVVSAAPTG